MLSNCDNGSIIPPGVCNNKNPSDDCFISPSFQIDNIEIVDDSKVTINWNPNDETIDITEDEEIYIEYQYKLIETGDAIDQGYSNWGISTFATYLELRDSTNYTFYLRSRYGNTEYEYFDFPLAEINFDVSYIRPETTINMGDIINSSNRTISWTTDPLKSGTESRFIIDNKGEWSEWSITNSHYFQYLDEGMHVLKVQSRYNELNVELDPVEKEFNVNAVDGPSYRIFPLHQNVTTNSNFNVEIFAEEIANVRYFECVIEYDNSLIGFDNYQIKDVLQNELFFVNEDVPGRIVITGGEYNNSVGYSGSGSIIQLTFYAAAVISQSTDITIHSDSKYFDVDGNEIDIKEYKSGIVEIE